MASRLDMLTNPATLATESLGRIVRIVPRSRNLESLLLAFALGLNIFELAQIQLSTLAKLRSDIWVYFLPVAVFALAIHIVLRLKASDADPLMLPITVTLNGLGIAEIYRLDLASVAAHSTQLFGFKQVVWTCLAMAAAALVIWFVPSHLFLRRFIYISMVVAAALLLSPMLPGIGKSINGARL